MTPTEVVRHVCRPSGPLAGLTKLLEVGSAEVISLLAEIDAFAVATLLEHALDGLTLEPLLQIDGDERRGLVRAAQTIAFCDDTFEQGARLIFALAHAENERWDNNATGEFKSLFSVFGGSTAAGPQERLQILDTLLDQETDPKKILLVVDALVAASETRGSYRAVGAEHHGSRPALKPWMPIYWKDARDYVAECVSRLAKLASRDDPVGEHAKASLGRELRSLVLFGLIDAVESAVSAMLLSGPYWPEALSSLGDFLVYDAKELADDLKARVQVLVARLTPTDINSRVRFLVTEMPWDYPVDEGLGFPERQQRQRADVEVLAKELLADPTYLKQVLPSLSRGNHRMNVQLGKAIGEDAEDPLLWVKRMRAAYMQTPEEERNFGLLAGAITGISSNYPNAVTAFKQKAALSHDLEPMLPFVCAHLGLIASDFDLVIGALQSKKLPSRRVSVWAYGGAMSSLPVNVVAPLFDTLLVIDDEGYWTALELIVMYVHGHGERLEGLRPQLRAVASNALNQPERRSTMDEHHFKELMDWLLRKGRADADAVAHLIAKQIARRAGKLEIVKPLLLQLLSGFPEIVWPIIGQGVVNGRKNAWMLENLLGDTFAFDDIKRPAIAELPEEVLFAWCDANPEKAPAFVAALLPVLTSSDPSDGTRSLTPRMKRLLDEFGNRKDVLDALTRNMHTFGWSGSRAGYYSLYDGPLRELESHRQSAVRRWAKSTRAMLRDAINDVLNDDEELEAGWG